jgi:hypothetical protein
VVGPTVWSGLDFFDFDFFDHSRVGPHHPLMLTCHVLVDTLTERHSAADACLRPGPY